MCDIGQVTDNFLSRPKVIIIIIIIELFSILRMCLCCTCY